MSMEFNELAESGSRLPYRWQLVGGEGGWLGIGSLAAAVVAVMPLVTAHALGWSPGVDVLPVWAAAGTFAGAVLAGLLWWGFSRRQDEMFQRMQAREFGIAGVLTAAVLAVWGVLASWHLADPIAPLAPLLVFAATKALVWTVTVRRWL